MSNLITAVDELTPAFLTGLLQSQGALDRGYVTGAEPEITTKEYATTAHLALTYSEDAPFEAPRRLFAKLIHRVQGSDDPSLAGREVAFYTTFAPLIGVPPLVRCYAAHTDTASGRSHLLLESVAETHGAPPFPNAWPLPPSYGVMEQVAAGLARCHAACWDHPRLGELLGGYPSAACSPNSIRYGAESYPRFEAELGDRLSADTRACYAHVLASYPTLDRRMEARRNLTAIHGDFLYGNVLLPHSPEDTTVRIIDWELANVNIGTFDLAEILSLHWDAGTRSEREYDLVRRYYAALLANGVTGYTWEECWDDYRLALINHLFTPLQQWADQHWPGFWWGRMERTLKRFVDFGCAELLGSI